MSIPSKPDRTERFPDGPRSELIVGGANLAIAALIRLIP
jgi:hypothetical protein